MDDEGPSGSGLEDLGTQRPNGPADSHRPENEDQPGSRDALRNLIPAHVSGDESSLEDKKREVYYLISRMSVRIRPKRRSFLLSLPASYGPPG